jgi:hypothetical protein
MAATTTPIKRFLRNIDETPAFIKDFGTRLITGFSFSPPYNLPCDSTGIYYSPSVSGKCQDFFYRSLLRAAAVFAPAYFYGEQKEVFPW